MLRVSWRCCASAQPHTRHGRGPRSSWMDVVRIKPNTVHQETRYYRSSAHFPEEAHRLRRRSSGNSLHDAEDEKGLPVRCLVAARNIARGERLAVVPESAILTGQRASQIIHYICRSLSNIAERPNNSDAVGDKASAACSASFPLQPCSTTSLSATNDNYENNRNNNNPNNDNMGGTNCRDDRDATDGVCTTRHTCGKSNSGSDSNISSYPFLSELQSYMHFQQSLRVDSAHTGTTNPHSLASTAFSASAQAHRSSPRVSRVDYLLSSRDALLITAALYLLRHGTLDATARNDVVELLLPSVLIPLHSWVHCLPARVPPLGLFIHEFYQDKRTHRAAKAASSAARASESLSAHQHSRLDCSAADLSIDAALSRGSLACYGDGSHSNDEESLATCVSSPVALTPVMLQNYLASKPNALTPRQQQSIAAYTTRPASRAAVGCLQRLDRELDAEVIFPLLRALYGNAVDRHCSSHSASLVDDKQCGANVDEDADGYDAVRVAAMRWSHFMLRSRGLNLINRSESSLRSRRCESALESAQPQLALIPFLDMLNHSHLGGNVSYHMEVSHHDETDRELAAPGGSHMFPAQSAKHRCTLSKPPSHGQAHVNAAHDTHSGGAVIVTASRAIAQGEELVLHYGHDEQRCCLFGSSFSLPAVCDARGSIHAVTHADLAAQAVRLCEQRQRFEMIRDEDRMGVSELRSTPHVLVCPFSLLSSSSDAASSCPTSTHSCADFIDQTPYTDGSSEQGDETQERRSKSTHQACQEAASEACWLWHFGFIRSAQERLAEASAGWSRTLRQRIARLTDVRRRGRPGEFVLGVPENLQALRSQREQLERERYDGARVFPPQSN